MNDLRDQLSPLACTEAARPVVCCGVAHALSQSAAFLWSKTDPALVSTELFQVMLAEGHS